MGKKGTYTRILDADGLTEKEKSALMHYLLGSPECQFNREKSIEAAGYTFEGQRPELHKRHEMDRILSKKNVQKIVQDVLEERENCIVWDKTWILQRYKEDYEACDSESVKRQLLQDMAKLSNMFGAGETTGVAGSGKGTAAKRARDNFNKRIKKARSEGKVLPFDSDDFYTKEGTNDEG